MSCTTRFSDLSERESALRDAIYARKTSRYARPPLGPYPRRPAAPLPPSRSVDVFRAILHHAPNLHTSDSRVKRHHDMFAGEWCCSWTEEYFSELFAALNDVLHEHGMGNDGWKSIRWEVYDKYSEYLGGSNIIDTAITITSVSMKYSWIQGKFVEWDLGFQMTM